MRLRANFRDLDTKLIPEDKIKLLHGIITSANRSFLEYGLREFNIPGRTKIYKSFGWSYNSYYDQTTTQSEDRERIQIRHVTSILEHSNFLEWVEAYCSEYRLGSLLSLVSQLELDTFNIRVMRTTGNN